MINYKVFIKIFCTYFKKLLFVCGSLLLCFIILSFTDIPYYAYYHLGISGGFLKGKPERIIVLGGAGMPSPDGLIRLYYASEAAKTWEDASIIIAFPNENDINNSVQTKLIIHELFIRGIDTNRIIFEPKGTNTYHQAMNCAKLLNSKNDTISTLLVSSPEHMYRAIKVYKKAGIKNIGGLPAFEVPLENNNLLNEEFQSEKSLAFRYNMWSYMHYEILVLREYCAIVFYKIRGWI